MLEFIEVIIYVSFYWWIGELLIAKKLHTRKFAHCDESLHFIKLGKLMVQ